jgi:hypothetical protein
MVEKLEVYPLTSAQRLRNANEAFIRWGLAQGLEVTAFDHDGVLLCWVMAREVVPDPWIHEWQERTV